MERLFLSTLSLRRATQTKQTYREEISISIHALLAESDILTALLIQPTRKISIHALLAESDSQQPAGATRTTYFYPRSPCGERPIDQHQACHQNQFLSTLSLRRATHYDNYNLHCVEISIHALLAESDAQNIS